MVNRIKKKNSRGEMLVETVVFIILNLVFLSILMVFLLNQSSNGKVLEEVYAKEIALMIDSAKPTMTISFDMEKAKKVSDKNGINFENIVRIPSGENYVEVKLTSEGGYRYYYFNDLEINPYPDSEEEGMYLLTIN